MVMLISMNCNDKSDFASGDYLFVFKAIKRELTLPNSWKGREYLKLILVSRRFVRKTFCQDRLTGGHILGIS